MGIVEMRLFKLAGLAGLSAASPTNPDNSEVSAGSNPFSDNLRVDCYPENGSDEAKCLARGCTWQPGERGSPWCFYPENYKHYNMISSSEGEVEQNGKMVPTKYFNFRLKPTKQFALRLSMLITRDMKFLSQLTLHLVLPLIWTKIASEWPDYMTLRQTNHHFGSKWLEEKQAKSYLTPLLGPFYFTTNFFKLQHTDQPNIFMVSVKQSILTSNMIPIGIHRVCGHVTTVLDLIQISMVFSHITLVWRMMEKPLVFFSSTQMHRKLPFHLLRISPIAQLVVF